MAGTVNFIAPHLVDWYIDIYISVYGKDTSYSDIILKFNTYLKQMVNSASFDTFNNIVISIGLALIMFYFFNDLSEKAVMKQLSILQMGKSIITVLCAVFIIFHSKNIFIFMLSFVESLNELLNARTSGYATITQFLSNDTVKLLLSRCVSEHFSLMSILGYTLMAILIELTSLATKIYVTYYAATRIIQLFVYYVFMPVGVADIFENGPGGTINTNSAGFRYLKTMFAIMLQLVVIALISQVYPSISTAINTGYFEDRGDDSLLYEDEEYGEMINETNLKAIKYPLNNFEYTDHEASILSVIGSTANTVWEGMQNLRKDWFGGGDDDENKGDDDVTSEGEASKNEESLKDNEIYKLSKVISGSGLVVNSDEAREEVKNIEKDSNYRMTVQSTELFFAWCVGADGGKMILFIILMITKILLIHSSANLCNYIVGVSV